MDSPRGRIFLAKLVADKRQDVRPAFKKHFDLCLACRCCESACPSGVRYHEIFDTAQQLIRETIPKPVFSRIMSTIALRVIFPNPKLLDFCIMMLWLYQKSGFRKIIQASRLLKVFSKKLALSESFLPLIKGIKKLRVSQMETPLRMLNPAERRGCCAGASWTILSRKRTGRLCGFLKSAAALLQYRRKFTVAAPSTSIMEKTG